MQSENMEALTAFLLDVNCLDRLDQWTTGVNLFEVLKVADVEIRHSNMLAWLLDPNENHGLDGAVLSEFVRFLAEEGVFSRNDALQLLLADWESFYVLREWKNIDILIASDAERIVIAIENKVWSDETPGQLDKYRETVRGKFGGYRSIFLFLTPDCDEASDSETWHSICYEDMVGIIERARKPKRVANEVELIIGQYLEIVRRKIVGDKDLERVCQDIYRRHKTALDLIYEHRPDEVQQVSDIVDEWCREKQREGLIEYLDEWSGKRNRLFISPQTQGEIPRNRQRKRRARNSLLRNVRGKHLRFEPGFLHASAFVLS